MLHSLSAQVSHYSDLIQRNSDWLYAGVYADEAKTGTKDSRADFQRLIADCHAGKIDMVITKSISRFARNTVTLLQTVRDFKAAPQAKTRSGASSGTLRKECRGMEPCWVIV